MKTDEVLWITKVDAYPIVLVAGYYIQTGPDRCLSSDNDCGRKGTSTGCWVLGSGFEAVSPHSSDFLNDSAYASVTSELKPGSISFAVAFVLRWWEPVGLDH